MCLYLDANAIIYSLEGVPRFRASALHWIDQALRNDSGALVTSRLSTLECRVKPLRDHAQGLLAEYEAFFRPRR